MEGFLSPRTAQFLGDWGGTPPPPDQQGGRDSPTTSAGSKGKRPRSDSMDPDGQFGASPPPANGFGDLTTLWETTNDVEAGEDISNMLSWVDSGIVDAAHLNEPTGRSDPLTQETFDFMNQIVGGGSVDAGDDPLTALENHPGLPQEEFELAQMHGHTYGFGSRPASAPSKPVGVMPPPQEKRREGRLPPSLSLQAEVFQNHDEARRLSNRLSQSAQPIRRHAAVMKNSWMSDQVIQPPPLMHHRRGSEHGAEGVMAPPPISKQTSSDQLSNHLDNVKDPSVVNFMASMFGSEGVQSFDQPLGDLLLDSLADPTNLSSDVPDANTTWTSNMKLNNVFTTQQKGRSYSTTRPPPSSRQKLSPVSEAQSMHQRQLSGGHQRTPSGGSVKPSIVVQGRRGSQGTVAPGGVGPMRTQNLPASENAHPYRFVENAKVKIDVKPTGAINLKMGPGNVVVPTLSAADEEELRSRTISFQELSKYFHLPINDASRELGVCTTVLKKVCRRHGINRWPQRKIKSLNRCIEALEAMIAQPDQTEKEKTRLQKKVGKLIQKRQLLIDNPNAKVNLRSNIKLNPTNTGDAAVKKEEEEEEEADDGDDDDEGDEPVEKEGENGQKNMSVEKIGVKNPPSPELLAAIRAKQGVGKDGFTLNGGSPPPVGQGGVK